MKKNVKLTAIIVMAVMLVGVLAGCSAASSIEGTWKVDKISYDGEEMTGADMEALLGGTPYYTFSSDGKMAMVLIEGALETEGTYKVDGSTVSMTVEGVTETAKLSGDTMTLDDPSTGAQMTLKKS